MIQNQSANLFRICAGRADAATSLNAFDHALLDAGVGDTNLIRLSSILPPGCKRVETLTLPYGGLIPVAYAVMQSSQPGELIAASMAIGIPEDDSLPGLMMEHHSHGSARIVEEQVREMVEIGMAHRKRAIREIVSIGIEHVVEAHGAVFAGVVLWHS